MMYTIDDIEENIDCPFDVVGNRALTFDSFDPISEAHPGSLSFLRDRHAGAADIIAACGASFVICQEFDVDEEVLRNKCLIRVSNPHLGFLRLLKNLHKKPLSAQTFIHPTAVVSSHARLGSCVYIGEYAVI